MDIISAILHNRGEKKIAGLLFISPKTVSSHVHNIMLKIGSHSKDGIIDFIEKSGKIIYVKHYYQINIRRKFI
jgi:DNA-binding CsgD family transcriptional regulator